MKLNIGAINIGGDEMAPSSVVFEPAGSDFEYGTYLGLRVIIMKENGFMNATRLCRQENKEVFHWRQNTGAEELIQEVQNDTNQDPILVVSIGENEYRGTYVHPLLIDAIAAWCSAKFHLKVAKILREYNERELRRVIASNDHEIAKLRQEVSELLQLGRAQVNTLGGIKEQNEAITKTLDGVRDQLDDTTERLDEVTGQLEETTKQNEQTNMELKKISRKLNIAVEDRVPKPLDPRKANALIVRMAPSARGPSGV